MRRSFRYPLLVVALCITAAFLIAAHYAAHPAQQVLITFEGPWAFAADPDDATSIFAFAPKTATHHDPGGQVFERQIVRGAPGCRGL